MPIQLRSISGMVPYDVEQMIRDMVQALDKLEQREDPNNAQIAQLGAALTALQTTVTSLSSRVQSVIQQSNSYAPEIATATSVPSLTATEFVKPPLHLDLVEEQHTLFPTQLATDPSAFTQTIASTLHNGGTIGSVTVSANPLWGRRRNISGVTSFDVIAYKQDGLANNPYSVDIGAGAGASGATPQWLEQGRVGGTWLEP